MVSIVIINYNTFSLTCNCIHSVIGHTKEVSHEIILVDNGSDECDPDLFKQKFPEIILIKNSKNLGFAGGNNQGIINAKGEYILLLNSDTILKNDAISLTVNEMKRCNVQLTTCKVLNADESVQPVCSFFPSVKFSILGFFGLIQLFRKLRLKKFSFEYDYSKTQKVEWIWGCFFLFKREILKQFPGEKFPEDYFMYGEDMQWCYLLRKKDIDAWYFPEGIIYHLFSGNKTSQDPSVNRGIRNRIIFLKRYYSRWRYTWIFFFETMTSLTRLRWKYLFKKVKLYFTLR